MTRNPVILKIFGVIKDVLSSCMVDIVRTLGVKGGLLYHGRILAAVRRGDEKLAQRLMAEHVEKTVQGMAARAR
jgi:GntR family transcriptional repressor for pyruvate dehydrogenase complex